MKDRLDNLVVLAGLANDVKEAQSLILAGKIIVGDQRVDKCGSPINTDLPIRLKRSSQFVSRGALKLQEGLKTYSISPKGLVCIDIGASSGGFSDYLLQNGAKKVFAVDVAYGQLNWKIRSDKRVIVLERFNAKKIKYQDINQYVDLAVMDVSFISCTRIIPALLSLFSSRSEISIITLIKPQFELPKRKVPVGGVVDSEELHNEAIAIIEAFCIENDLKMAPAVASPILGPKGNKEFLTMITASDC